MPRSVFGWDQLAVPRAVRQHGIDVLYNPKYSIPLRAGCPAVWVCHGLDWYVMPWASRASTGSATASSSAVRGHGRGDHRGLRDHPRARDALSPGPAGAGRDRLLGRGRRVPPAARPSRLAEVRRKYALPERFLLVRRRHLSPQELHPPIRAYARVGPERGIPSWSPAARTDFSRSGSCRSPRPWASAAGCAGPAGSSRRSSRRSTPWPSAAAPVPVRVLRAAGARGDGGRLPGRDRRSLWNQGAGRARRGAGRPGVGGRIADGIRRVLDDTPLGRGSSSRARARAPGSGGRCARPRRWRARARPRGRPGDGAVPEGLRVVVNARHLTGPRTGIEVYMEELLRALAATGQVQDHRARLVAAGARPARGPRGDPGPPAGAARGLRAGRCGSCGSISRPCLRPVQRDQRHPLPRDGRLPPFALRRRDRCVATVHDLGWQVHPEIYRPGCGCMYGRCSLGCPAGRPVIAVSRYTADDLMRRAGVPAAKIDVVYHGLDPAFGPADPVAQPPAPSAEPPYILAVGGVSPRKNTRRLIEAFRGGAGAAGAAAGIGC